LPRRPDQADPECREVVAAEKANEYAGVALIIGGLQFAALIGQIIALIWTIRQTRNAVAASQRSAKAAEDAVAKSDEMLAHSRDAAIAAQGSHERTERAYLFVGISEIEPIDFGAARVELSVRNSGRTPGILKTRMIGRMILPLPPEPDLSLCDASETDLVYAAGETGVLFNALDVTNNQVLYGEISYEDIFGHRRHSRYCFQIDVEMKRGRTLGAPALQSWS
jgi:hypothetical protein